MIATEYCKKVFDGTHDSPKPVENGRLLITSKHIANRNLDISSAYLISEEDFENVNKRSQVHQWDILFSMIGTVGNVYIETSEKIDYAIKNMGVFSCQNKEKAYWLYYYLQSPLVQAKIDALMAGAVQKFVSLGFLRDLDIPEYTENSKKVVQVLSALDDKIALNKKMNQKLEAIAKRLYDYWFVQYDFPDKNGHPYKTTGGPMTYNPTLKREIPAEWTDGVLCDIANITMGQSPDGSSYNEDGEGMIFYQGSTDFGMRFPMVRQYTTAPTRFAKKGDILMSVRAPVGAVNIANTDCCIGRGLSALNSKLGSLSHLYFLIDVFKKTFENKNTVGTTFGSITKDELYALPVVIPDKNVIEKFEKMAKPIFDRQMKLGEESNRLTKLRDKLLPLLMNGQVATA